MVIAGLAPHLSKDQERLAAEAEVGPCEYAGYRVVLIEIKAYLKRQKTSSSGIV